MLGHLALGTATLLIPFRALCKAFAGSLSHASGTPARHRHENVAAVLCPASLLRFLRAPLSPARQAITTEGHRRGLRPQTQRAPAAAHARLISSAAPSPSVFLGGREPADICWEYGYSGRLLSRGLRLRRRRHYGQPRHRSCRLLDHRRRHRPALRRPLRGEWHPLQERRFQSGISS
jgi:hypothetical protein